MFYLCLCGSSRSYRIHSCRNHRRQFRRYALRASLQPSAELFTPRPIFLRHG
jgi:hypothetical protein